MLLIVYLSYIFLIWPLLEARAEMQKYLCWFLVQMKRLEFAFKINWPLAPVCIAELVLTGLEAVWAEQHGLPRPGKKESNLKLCKTIFCFFMYIVLILQYFTVLIYILCLFDSEFAQCWRIQSNIFLQFTKCHLTNSDFIFAFRGVIKSNFVIIFVSGKNK